MKKIGIICASGIGDALIMHTVSHHLQTIGWDVTTFSRHLPSFGAWLSGYKFAPQLDGLDTFDAFFLQHDNSPKANQISALKIPVYTFYGSHIPEKHGPFRSAFDYACDKTKTMLENAQLAAQKFFGSSSKDNGLRPPAGLIHRKYPNRIAIHPTSASEEKNWPREKFLRLASLLEQEGYEPIFTVSPSERSEWPHAPLFSTLEQLASFLYESGTFIGNDSGLGHLASALQIPPLILGPSEEQLRFWRPGWLLGEIAFPPFSRWKWGRKRWKSLLSARRTFQTFKGLTT